MALSTRSKFYYGVKIPATSTYIAFQETTGPVRSASLKAGSYSLTGFANEIQRALRAAGTQSYLVSINRTTRIITISAPLNFTVFIATGPYAGAEIYSIMGFPLANLSGTNSYSGTSSIGLEFKPQFFLLDYVSTEHLQDAVDASINETGSGELEVIRYGTKKLMRCNIDFVTNENLGAESWIESNSTGVEDCISFLQDITQKSKIEFIPDRDKPEEFQTFVLESTASNRSGLGYELREKTGEGLIGYFTTGLLTFRLLE
jgi:hypothetical protein